ncbi:BMP family lipoprotein [Streptomyces hygroscopicus]|uniref:BMP family lipoprotein n=1 Tax=Streptomyces hygroscopicus TaxID=1912 RepID=UPI00223F399A|nr:BMP family ABC transporter substrate-binding protein [Streptomyces hygroscopicus]
MAVTVIALAAVGCGKSSTESAGGSDKSSSGYTGKGIGLAYDIGGKGDQSFNDAAFSGFQRAEKEFKIGGRDVEPQDNESDADKVQRLEQLAKSGYNPIIGVGFVYAPAVKEVAAKYPKITFGIIDDNTVQASNVADLVFHEEQSSYLAGVAAAKTTKKNHIGFIGGVDIPLIHKFEAGFDQGARSVDPKIKIESQYLTQTPQEGGFSSPDKGKEATNGQIAAGADVIYHAAGLSGQGVIQAAAAHKVWAIGVDSDQYQQSALAAYKDYILGSALKNVGGAVYELVKSVVEGKPLTGEQRGDLKSGGVGFADSNPKYQAMKDVVAAVEKAKQDIIAGKIAVNTK